MMRATDRANVSRSIDYEIAEGHLPAGSTLGSPKAVALVKATGALARLYSCDADADAFGAVLVRHWRRPSGVALQSRGRFVLAPERQERFAELPSGLRSRERIFVLAAPPRGPGHSTVQAPAAYYEVSLRNEGGEALELDTYAAVRLCDDYRERVEARFDDAIGAFVVRTEERPAFVRIAATTAESAGWEVTNDHGKLESPAFPGPLADAVVAHGADPIAIFHLQHALEPGAAAEFAIVLTFAPDGEAAACKNLASLPNCSDALALTQAYYRDVLERGIVMTPEPEVERGASWAKANMMRSALLTPQGWCIVNDPTETTHVVARDTAWFALGADYVLPWFSSEALRVFFDRLTETGMAVEYYDTLTGKAETYGLDINDNTPLLMWACWHHYCVTGDLEFLRSMYPNIVRAARCILSKRGAHGLVWCRAEGTGAHGIVGWRNALEGRRLAGATTELNCECFAALRAASCIATQLGDGTSAATFSNHADELKAAINHRLLDASRNLYYLALDEDGRPRTDVTADLVFPILFGVAEPEVAAAIVKTLSSPEFWSAAGLRTSPRNSIEYTPGDCSGLLGGVWAASTFWLATAAAAVDPELTARALTAAFRHYAEDPIRYNTVPGQFCEWLHGETLTNHGMLLSPWFAPKYLWATIEGAAGLEITAQPPKLHRRLPPGWSWLAARNVSVRGRDASWFTVRMERITTYLASAERRIDADRFYERDASGDVTLRGDAAVCVALRKPDGIVVFVGNAAPNSIATSVCVSALPQPPAMHRIYDSATATWSAPACVEPDRARLGWPLLVAAKGFAILEICMENR